MQLWREKQTRHGLLRKRSEQVTFQVIVPLGQGERVLHPSWTGQPGSPSGTQNANPQPSRPGHWLVTVLCDAG